jgi:predicted Zn-dependent peptidase
LAITTTRLDCGLTVLTERLPDVRSVALGFWVGTGSRDEEPEFSGASHFLEHLLFKGTEMRSAREIAEAVDEVGGDSNAFTTKEYTAFYIRVLSDALDMAVDLLSDIMWAPAFRPAEVEAERQVILEEILMHADEPADLVHEALCAALFPRHPLGLDVLGDQATVSAMSRDEIAAFHARHYRAANVVVAVAGDLDHDKIVAGIERTFAGSSGGDLPLRVPPPEPQATTVVVTRPTEQAHLVVGVPALDRDDEHRYPLAVLNHIVGGGMSSRLFQEIRERRGLAYSVYSYRSLYQGAGTFAVYVGTSPSKTREVLGLIHAELDRLIDRGVTDRELRMAKSHLLGSLALSLEDSGARMSRLGRSQLVHGRVPPVEELERQLRSVALTDVDSVIRRVLTGPRVVAGVGPFGEEDLEDRR